MKYSHKLARISRIPWQQALIRYSTGHPEACMQTPIYQHDDYVFPEYSGASCDFFFAFPGDRF
jgi:hypothetical protein